MIPRSILAVTDFSSCGNHALSRAALLAAQHGAALRLAGLACPADASPEDASTRLAHHALQLGQRHGLRASAAGRLGARVEDLVPEARHADLVVWGSAPAGGLRSFFMGKPVEQLIRAARRAVLVVRREAAHDYRSLIVAVDFSRSSGALVDFGLALAPPARAELFHAVSTANEGKLRYAEVSARAIRAYRDACRRHAQDRMLRLTDSYDARRNRVRSAVGHGDPARQTVVQQHHSGAELIVVGRHPSSRWTDLFFESTASRILDIATTDVLVVPHDREPASGAHAVTRLAAEPLAVRRVRAGAPEPPSLPDPAAVFAREQECGRSALLSFGWSAAAMGR
ncbi:MAG: universal stress protein [Bordetella sp.]|nr:universal stress protein [Pseudomonadota bacterium]MDQ8018601.1 universal stress protein [Pseudomonadota bacterium]